MIKQYKKTCDYSYTLGFYPTLELIKRRKDLLRFVYASNQALESDGFRLIEKLVDKSKIIISDNALEKLSDKGNDFVAGVFNKEEQTLDKTKTHVVLVNPSDMGNLGNIMRSMLAFDYNDLAIITPAADMYNPKTVRASMGAMFGIRIEKFSSFEEYLSKYERPYVPFMLQAKRGLKEISTFNSPFALVFGNEATGLPITFLNDEAVKIEQSDEVDSLNLHTAVAIALYVAKSNLIGFAPFNVTENTKYLILGSFPSVKSLEGDFYYLHPQNKFYKLIANFFNEDYPQTISDKKNVLIRHNIALWDIVKSCKRDGSLDSNIKEIVVNDLYSIKNISNFRIGCTGKKSYELTKKYFPNLNVFYLSSPSPANVKYFDIQTWKIFFNN